MDQAEGPESTAGEGESLMAKTASGAGWVVGFRMVTRLLGLLNTLVLARILGPGDFGLVALANGFTSTVDALVNFSVDEAIVRDHAPDRPLYDTAFTLSLARGLATSLAVAAAAYPVAAFFHEPRLVAVLLALAASSLIAALENVRAADLVRNFQFAREFRLWTVPRIVSVVVGIAVALVFRTYWALVIAILAGRILRTAMSYAMIPYLPRISLAAWRRILGFTTWSWVAWMLVIARDRADVFLIGRLFSSAQVGVYALGVEIAQLPNTELIEPLSRACFPSFSELRRQGLTMGSSYVRLLGAACTVVLPAGVGIAAVADPLVRLAFGPDWDGAIPMIQILGVSGILGVIGTLSGTMFSASGLLRTSCAIAAVALVVRIALLVLLVPGGTLTTAAATIALITVLEQATILSVTVRRFAVPVRELVAALGRTTVATAAMAATMAWTGLGFRVVTTGIAEHLALSVALGAAAYTVFLGLLWRLAGCPAGPERDLLRAAARITRRFRARLPFAARG